MNWRTECLGGNLTGLVHDMAAGGQVVVAAGDDGWAVGTFSADGDELAVSGPFKTQALALRHAQAIVDGVA